MKSKNIFSLILVTNAILPTVAEKTKDYMRGEISNKIIFEDSRIRNSLTYSNEIIESSILIKLNYDLDPILFEGNSIDERQKLFQEHKKLYQKKNKDILDKINFDIDGAYVSNYSPFISFNLEVDKNTTQILNKIALNDEIENIFVSTYENKTNLEMAKKFVGAREIINSGELSGDGIVVGLLEPGIVDKNHDNFSSTNLEIRNELFYSETPTEHANIMGSIIAGKNGIAKKAKLLSVELNGDPISEIDWLLDRGVNIINCSYGDASPNGIYSSKSAYMDYIVDQYKVTIVSSSGNVIDNNKYVANPGLGYNVLTVGSCSNTSYVPRSFSCYQVQDGPQKPNIVAPGYSMNIYPFGLQEGTSVSAAFTTGCIALLMEKCVLLRTSPEMVRTLLMANANKVNDSFGYENGLNDIVGAGGLNFSESRNGYNHALIRRNFESNPNSKLSSFVVTLNKNQTVRAALSYLARATGNANETEMSEYDIVIIDSNKNVVSQTRIKNDNVGFIEFKSEIDETYEIWIYQRDKFVSQDTISLAYKIV